MSAKRYIFTTLLIICFMFPVISIQALGKLEQRIPGASAPRQALEKLEQKTIALAAADEAAQNVKRLQDLKKNMDKVKKEKSSVVAKEKSILTELKTIEKQLGEKEKELRVHEKNLTTSEIDLLRLNGKLTLAEQNLKQTQEMANRRIRAMYKFGYRDNHTSYLKLLLGAESVIDFTNKYKYMSAIAEGDKNLLDKAMINRVEVGYQKKLVENKKEQIFSYKNETEKVKKEILGKKITRQSTLTKVQESKEELTKAQKELEGSINRLENLIAQLRDNQDSSKKQGYNKVKPEGIISSMGNQGGNLPWPVSGSIIPNSSSSMKGVTIRANQGVEIRCVDNGIVDYARWFDGVGYGQMVIINHGNGYRTLYAHASELLVKEGQKVKKGQAIARVGDTGSLNGPMLYFEVWKGATALPTRQWLANQ